MPGKAANLKTELGRGNIAPVYLLVGEESYLRQYYRGLIKKAVLPEDDTVNLQIFSGEKTDPEEVIAQADTMPFFADHRLLILEDTGFFKKSCDVLNDYIPNLPAETVLVFSERAGDKRQKLWKTVEKYGWVQECPHPGRDAMGTWILKALAARNTRITGEAREKLLDVVHEDMWLAVREIDKLCAYTEGREGIVLADVQAVCTVPPQDKLFDMIRAIASGNQRETIRLYHDLLELQTKPLSILYNLQKEFREMLTAKDLRDQGFSTDMIAGKMKGKASWMVSRLLRQGSSFSEEEMRAVLTECARTEESIKTGKVGDRIGVETLIVKVSGRPERPGQSPDNR